jgi:hypothetical protein
MRFVTGDFLPATGDRLRTPEHNTNPETLALGALGWTLGDPQRAQRLLDLTGLSPDDLRHRAGEWSVLSAVLGFLEAYEPDLVACAETLGTKPESLVAARRELER